MPLPVRHSHLFVCAISPAELNICERFTRSIHHFRFYCRFCRSWEQPGEAPALDCHCQRWRYRVGHYNCPRQLALRQCHPSKPAAWPAGHVVPDSGVVSFLRLGACSARPEPRLKPPRAGCRADACSGGNQRLRARHLRLWHAVSRERFRSAAQPDVSEYGDGFLIAGGIAAAG